MSMVARKLRAVSAREVSRRLSRLLDEIEADGSAVLVVRYGRPTAVLAPFHETGDAIKLPRFADLGVEFEFEREIDDEDEHVKLDEIQQRILLDIANCTALNWVPGSIPEGASVLAVSLTRLELAGFIERAGGAARRLTRKGERLARRLDSTA